MLLGTWLKLDMVLLNVSLVVFSIGPLHFRGWSFWSLFKFSASVERGLNRFTFFSVPGDIMVVSYPSLSLMYTWSLWGGDGSLQIAPSLHTPPPGTIDDLARVSSAVSWDWCPNNDVDADDVRAGAYPVDAKEGKRLRCGLDFILPLYFEFEWVSPPFVPLPFLSTVISVFCQIKCIIDLMTVYDLSKGFRQFDAIWKVTWIWDDNGTKLYIFIQLYILYGNQIVSCGKILPATVSYWFGILTISILTATFSHCPKI